MWRLQGALATEPRLLLLDEPFAAMDIKRQAAMRREEGKIALVGSADKFLAKKYDLGGQLTEDLDIESHGKTLETP